MLIGWLWGRDSQLLQSGGQLIRQLIAQRRPLHNESTHTDGRNPSASAREGTAKKQTATEKVNKVFQTEFMLQLHSDATGKRAIFPANCMEVIYSKGN